VHTKSTRALHRYRRPSAITLTAVCVLAGGGMATASPAAAAETVGTPVAASVTGPLPWRAGSKPLVWTQPVHRAPLRRIVSHLTAAAITPSRTTVRPGVAVTLTGTVTYGAAIRVRAQLVTLQAQHGDAWQTVETQRLSGSGYATFTITPAASQTYRLAFGGSRGLAAVASPAVRVTVATPVAAVASTSTSSGSGYRATSLAFSKITGGTGLGARVVALAAAQTGKPYVFAAAGPSSFDCSGLTEYVFAQVGISLPHKADAQKSYGVGVSASAALPGDLVVFLSGGVGYHVGIYAGNGYMYDAPHTGTTVGLHAVYDSNVIFRRLV
jgi:cell wall-associated NlpC family hydrolase